MKTTEKLFSLGEIVTTPGVIELMKKKPKYNNWVNDCLKRYTLCDWGDLGAGDKENNDTIVKQGEKAGRILGRYNNPDGNIYIITGKDGNRTNIMFTSEY